MQQPRNNKLDLTYGFPGKLPHARHIRDRGRLLRFFELHASGMHTRKAALAAGFSEKWAKQTSYRYLEDFSDYLEWLRASFAQQAMKVLAIEQEDVLQGIARIAFANDFDYLVIERPPGLPPTVRRKRLHELTREQMAAIEVHSTGGVRPRLTWRFRDRDGKLFELGRALGMFNEKILLEHRHAHLHMIRSDFSKVPMEEIVQLEEHFEKVLMIEHRKEDEHAQRAISAIRGGEGQDAEGGPAARGGEDLGRQDHKRGRRGSPSPPTSKGKT